LTYLGDSYGWGCERTPAEREKEREFYGIYFRIPYAKECPKLRIERTAELFGRENVF